MSEHPDYETIRDDEDLVFHSHGGEPIRFVSDFRSDDFADVEPIQIYGGYPEPNPVKGLIVLAFVFGAGYAVGRRRG